MDNITLNKKILYEEEYETYNFIKSIENLTFKLITNIFILLKDNEHIYHINNYDNFNNIDDIKNNIPLMCLLGGSCYSIYSKLFNEYYKKDIISIDENLINSIDYDFSIMVNPSFNKEAVIQIIKNIVDNNKKIIFELNNNSSLNVIEKKDIKNDLFLKNKQIINKNYDKILITYSHSYEYTGIQFTLKFNNKLFQIVELLFWHNFTISDNINIFELTKNKCILYQTDNFKILLPNLSILIKSNIISMKSRIKTSQFNKCTKDYYRIKYIKLIYDIISNEINTTNNNIINEYILSTKKIYDKNMNIFKFPYTICSLNNIDSEKELIYNLYNKFLNLNIKKQIKILLDSNIDNEENKIKIENIKL